MNLKPQKYGDVELTLINRKDYNWRKAKRYVINGSHQNIWIPNQFLEKDGTIKPDANLSFIFNKAQTKHKINLSRYDYQIILRDGGVVEVTRQGRQVDYTQFETKEERNDYLKTLRETIIRGGHHFVLLNRIKGDTNRELL